MDPSRHPFLLTSRQLRRELTAFLDMLTLMLGAGYDLQYAWNISLDSLSAVVSMEFRSGLGIPEGGRFIPFLQTLSQRYPDGSVALWLAILAELYENGCGLGPCLEGMRRQLQLDEESDWQTHARNLPLKLSLILALFFFAPALVLIFLPLLWEMPMAF